LNQFVCQISFSFLLQTLETHPSGSFTNSFNRIESRTLTYRSSRKVDKWKHMKTWAYLLKLIHWYRITMQWYVLKSFAIFQKIRRYLPKRKPRHSR
jgi:hypothetical protein